MSSIRFARHASVEAFEVSGAELCVGGVPIGLLAVRAGSTPFYAYSRAALTGRVSALRAELPSTVHLHYAMKANPMPAVVQHLVGLVDGIDVASIGEMKVALDAGAQPSRVSFAGPAKSARDIEQAVAAGIFLNLESELQLQYALGAAARLRVTPNLAIRINPSFELKSSGMKMGGGPKQFGVDETVLPAMVDRMRKAGILPRGFHIYCGSQNLNADAIIDAQNKTVDLAIRLCDELGIRLDWLNIGGGFGVPYFPGEQALDVHSVGANLTALAVRAERELHAQLHIELGRYLVAEAGVYVCRVVDVKDSQGERFVIVDGGLNHNLAASGNLGQVIRKNYPVAIINRMDESALMTQTVTGPLCTPLDTLAYRMDFPVARPGDLIAVFLAGAYGPSASPLGFLSHPHPMELLV